MEIVAKDGDSPVRENRQKPSGHLSNPGHEKSGANQRAHPVRLNTPERPIANQYCEGKVKRTSNRGVKETLKPCAYKRSEHVKM